ncbi:flavohemoglobin expression-modulating QEGLA motif protein [Patescibacteria group bacterium]|nr:flavohemoglobin expression-modulating QEGLA motif protein [Patescibacteria group bacterium]
MEGRQREFDPEQFFPVAAHRPEKADVGDRQREALDQKWYGRFAEAGAFEAAEYLDGDRMLREQEKQKFLSGEEENPHLDYPKINHADLDARERKLLELKRDIREQEHNEVVRDAYRWKINEKIAELRMLKATVSGDMRRFGRYTRFIYGDPDPGIFAYSVGEIRADINARMPSLSVEAQEAACAVLAALPDHLPQGRFIALPDEETVRQAEKQTRTEMGSLIAVPLEGFAEKEKLDAEQIRDVFASALNALPEQGWEAVLDATSRTGINISQEERGAHIPITRTVTVQKLRQLLAHEVGTHVMRRINGERSTLKLLGLGLDRYLPGEEGTARMREQAIEGNVKEFAGLGRHLAISLTRGLDGVPRDFRETYGVLEKYFAYTAMAAGKTAADAQRYAQDTAWSWCVRTFRGTDAATRGVCCTKDIVYREGNIGVWDVLGKNPQELIRLSVGKYDPANSRHVYMLEALGITDQDIADLNDER